MGREIVVNEDHLPHAWHCYSCSLARRCWILMSQKSCQGHIWLYDLPTKHN